MPRFIDVFLEPNPNCEECGLRFKAEDEPRVVTRVRWYDDSDRAVECAIVGWSSAGGGSPVPAMAVTIEDSSSGVAALVYGGDWGLRLTPIGGGESFGQSHLRIGPDDLLG